MAAATGTGTTFLSDAFADVNVALNSFVDTFSAGIAAEIAPIVFLGMVFAFIMLGILALRGMLDRPFTEVGVKMLKLSIITAFALSTTVFQTYVVDVFLTLPDDIVTGVVSSSVPAANLETGESAARAIEQLFDLGMHNAGLYYEEMTIGITGTNLMPLLNCVLILIGTLLCVSIGTLWLFIAKIVLAMMLGVAPIFIIMLAWQPTQQFFFSWLGAVFNTVITSVFVIAIFAIFTAIFQVQLTALVVDTETNNFAEAASFVFLGLVCMGVLITIPQYVAQLTAAAGGAVGQAMLKVSGGGASMAKSAGGSATGGARGAVAGVSAGKAYNQSRASGKGVVGSAREARHEFNRKNDDIKRGYPDYFRNGGGKS